MSHCLLAIVKAAVTKTVWKSPYDHYIFASVSELQKSSSAIAWALLFGVRNQTPRMYSSHGYYIFIPFSNLGENGTWMAFRWKETAWVLSLVTLQGHGQVINSLYILYGNWQYTLFIKAFVAGIMSTVTARLY